jgi:hypothetical protein
LLVAQAPRAAALRPPFRSSEDEGLVDEMSADFEQAISEIAEDVALAYRHR